MNNSIFGEMIFNTGWKAATEITLFGKTASITVKAKAYYEKDGITTEQEAAFSDFNDNKVKRLKIVEKLLSDYSVIDTSNRFTPRTLLFDREGGYAILFDDKSDVDNGVVVCLLPTEKVLTQDEYL